MKIKTLLTSLLLLITGAGVDTVAQSAFNLGSQITSESSIVSGKAYVLRHGGNGTAMPYVVDNGADYDVPNTQNSVTEACIYFLISNGNGTWKIKSYVTGKYWGVPVNAYNLSSTASEESAGAWSLNFSNGVAYPTAPDASNAIQRINRSSQKIYMTAGKDLENANNLGNANKIYIYELDVLTSPVNITSGWYQIKWVTLAGQTGTGYSSDNDVAGKYVRSYATEVTVSTKKYPLYLDDAPTTIEENAASLVYVDFKETVSQNGKDLSGVHCSLRSASGHYIATDGSASVTATDNYIILVSAGTPNISAISSGYRNEETRYSLVPMGGDATPYIGQTSAGKFPNVNMYAVNPAYLGLLVWKVVIVNGSENEMVTYTGSDAYGLKSVYNGGTFFLTSGVTPTVSNFTYDSENKSVIVDGVDHRIIVTPSETLLASDVAIIQGNETTGKGNTTQALLRLKITPTLASTPTALALTLTGVDQLSNVAIYRTTGDELAADATPVKISGDITPSGTLNIPLTTAVISDGETAYLWVTADVKSNATEWATIDAAVTGITYTNMMGETGKVLDLTASGNPTGEMRIFKQQTALWTSSHANTTYYRIPTMINTADGGIVALTDLRYDHPYDLGKNASNGVGTHKIDVVSRRSTDGGLTWQSEVTVAAGDGSTAAGYGYGDPAIVRDADGTLHCLMAAGNTSYADGMLHMGYSKSADNGATWSTVEDILPNGEKFYKGGLSLQSAFTTGGKGVTFSNGRMAFAFLGKVSGTTNIYPLYSDDKGATWHVQSTVACGGGDESKLEIMNDNSLLLSVRKGSYNGTAPRAHNRTTGDASGDGIGSWGEASNWGSEMNANGCNADILYYNRETENASRPDVIFHTLTKAYSTYRKDLRLYMSFDQGETWKEAFQLQPGYAAYSSMQKLANGDLAIIYEDGSIGNNDKQDCYAINYVVLSSEIINAKIDELYDELNTVKIVYGTTGETTYGTLSSNTWTSNDTNNPISGLTLTKSDGEFNKFSSWLSHYNLAYKPATADTASKLTLTAPDGYIIKSYSMLAAKSSADAHTYTLTTAKGTEFTPAYNSYTTIKVDDIYSKSTAISVTTTNAAKYIAIADFSVVLTPYYPVALNTVGDASYATLYLPFDVTTDANTKAYYIRSTSGEYARLTEVTNSEIAANTAVVLINESSNSATFNVTSGLVQQISKTSNMLKGTLVPMSLDLSDETSHYSLGKKDGTIGFYKFDKNGNYTITLGANKAYLDTSASSGVKGFLFSFDDENNIEEIVDSKSSNGECYNLAGQRLSKPMKGINIVNGKKVVIK